MRQLFMTESINHRHHRTFDDANLDQSSRPNESEYIITAINRSIDRSKRALRFILVLSPKTEPLQHKIHNTCFAQISLFRRNAIFFLHNKHRPRGNNNISSFLFNYQFLYF
mmetsp:Transcript_77550/g.157474  ORF Transcript_77550/g.157474 Transcript_77550/m.157474 type:complete len:111 (-) Transcript_77550:1904-2236(-)